MPTIVVLRKKEREVFAVDQGLVDLLKEWDGEIKVVFGRGDAIPSFNPVSGILRGGYHKVRVTLENAGLSLPRK